MTKYINYKIHLSEGQKRKVKKSLSNKEDITLKLSHADLAGEDDILALTKTQINRINKAINEGRGITISLSQTQIKYNTKMKGGSLAALAGILARAALIAKTLGTTIGLSALSGAAQTGIQKLLGGGLYLNKNGHTMQVQSDGRGLFLYPTSGKGFKGDGLYLKSGE